MDGQDDTRYHYTVLENLNGARPDTPFTFSSHNGSEDFFPGERDDIHIYRKALSETELSEPYRFEAPLSAQPGQFTPQCRSSILGRILFRVACCSFLLISAGVAGEVVDWPDDDEKPKDWKTVLVKNLPPGVSPRDPEDPERPLTTVQMRKIDADGDGAVDLIVDTGRGGTGGSYIYVYRQEGKHYREVLFEQGGIVVRSKGMIECWSRIGGMEYRRTIYRFDGKRFEAKVIEVLRHRGDEDRLEVIEKKKP